MPTTHIIPLERRTLHGHFSPDLPPILTIQPGDTVISSALDANWFAERISPEADALRRTFEPRDLVLDAGHALIGPIYVEGTRPGQTLAIHIQDLKPGSWGWSAAGGYDTWINQHFGYTEADSRVWHVWDLDSEAMIGRNQHGTTVALRPFLGLIGMPPPEPGIHSTTPPRLWGGNLDCRALVVGSTVYLPAPVAGGLLSFGDGHAAQGDGEVSGIALECPMDRIVLQIDVRDDFPVEAPAANTPDGWIVFAVNENLNTAAMEALDRMVTLIERLHHVGRRDALALASLAVDLRITQIANRVNGVHALLPHGAIR
jgi:acetamidase/formamidase